MAAEQLITRDNYAALLSRSTAGRAGSPEGNVFFDTANDTIELITAAEVANVNLLAGLEANPLTHTDKAQALALYFFVLQEVQADPALQNFRFAMDAVVNRMGKLVGATAFLNAITLAANTSTTNSHDRDKIADSGFSEFAVGGALDTVFHGVKSQSPINATSQPFYQLVTMAGLVPTEAERQAATPVNFANPGNINEAINTYTNGGVDNRTAALVLGVRDFGYTVGESSSIAAGVSELGAYLQGYGIGNEIAADIAALTEADVWGGGAVVPYTNLTFFRHPTAQTRTGFAATGAGTSGDFTDEIVLSAGTLTLLQLRAWLDKLMQQDSDENANTGTTGVWRPLRAEALYTIDKASAKLVTRAGLYIDPAKLSADAQQNIVMVDDAAGQHNIPFNAGISITVSAAWLADTGGWFRMLYSDAAALNDFDTLNAVTALDAAAVAISGTNADSRITGTVLSLTYAYDIETAGGNVTAGADQIVVFQIGGIDASKSRTVEFTITRSGSISVDATTAAETN